MTRRQKNRGFTLIEVLIALGIFSVMSIMAYGGLKTVLNARNGTERAAERLSEMQMAFLLIQQDMQHMAPRSIRVGYSEEAALSANMESEYQISFTRGGNSTPRRRLRSGLYRVAYQLEEGVLNRLVWTTLDRTDDSVPRKMVLLRGVSDVAYTIDGGGGWPALGANVDMNALPKMVEMTVVLDDWGTITRTFGMPF